MEYLQKEKLPQKTEANDFLSDFLNLGWHNLYKAVKWIWMILEFLGIFFRPQKSSILFSILNP